MPRTLNIDPEHLKKRFLDKRWAQLAAGTAYRMGNDAVADMAAGLSYYALMSVFPLLIGVVAVLGFIFPLEVVQRQLLAFFEINLPTSVGLLRENISSVLEFRGILGILSLAALFWSGGALFAGIERATNRAWSVLEYRPFYVRKLRDFVLGIGTGIIFFISLGLTAIQGFFPQATLPFGITLTSVITQLVDFSLVFTAFLLVYRYMPNTRVEWKDVWMAAFLGAVLFEAIRNLFALYLDRFANFQVIYGSIASVIAFLVWIYLSAFVLVAGIEFSAEYAKMNKESKTGPPAVDKRGAPPD